MIDGIEISGLGRLTIYEVYEEFDGPRLFACRSDGGRWFIAFWAGQIEASARWLLAPMTIQRWSKLRIGQIPLRKALTEADGGHVWEVVVSDAGVPSATAVPVNELEEEDLPTKDAALDESPVLVAPGSLAAGSVSSRRDELIFSLDMPPEHPHAIECEYLGSSLLRFQSAIRAFGAGPSSSAYGRLARRAERGFTLLAQVPLAGSFEVHLVSQETSGLVNSPTPTSCAIDAFMKLWSFATSDEVVAALHGVGPKAAVRFSWFIESLAKAKANVTIQWLSTSGGLTMRARSALSLSDLSYVLAKEEKGAVERYSLIGTMVGLDVKSSRFHFIDEKDHSYRGVIDVRLAQEASTGKSVRIPSSVQATIEEHLVLTMATGEESADYVLIDVVTTDKEGAQPNSSGER